MHVATHKAEKTHADGVEAGDAEPLFVRRQPPFTTFDETSILAYANAK